jgi:hypothetical protein
MRGGRTMARRAGRWRGGVTALCSLAKCKCCSAYTR